VALHAVDLGRGEREEHVCFQRADAAARLGKPLVVLLWYCSAPASYVQVKLGACPEGFPITALREINVLVALKHPNIVQVKEMVVGSSVDKVGLVGRQGVVGVPCLWLHLTLSHIP
jgi:hypothetical protein